MTCTGKESKMTDHEVVSREEWEAARSELLAREKEPGTPFHLDHLAPSAWAWSEPVQAGSQGRRRAASALATVLQWS